MEMEMESWVVVAVLRLSHMDVSLSVAQPNAAPPQTAAALGDYHLLHRQHILCCVVRLPLSHILALLYRSLTE
jgi:hypothetical protein